MTAKVTHLPQHVVLGLSPRGGTVTQAVQHVVLGLSPRGGTTTQVVQHVVLMLGQPAPTYRVRACIIG